MSRSFRRSRRRECEGSNTSFSLGEKVAAEQPDEGTSVYGRMKCHPLTRRLRRHPLPREREKPTPREEPMGADGSTELQGTGYGRQHAVPNDLLTRVGPRHTVRRIHAPLLAAATRLAPCHQSAEGNSHLGEDLIVFRDKAGRAGLLYPRCMHRGTTLFYGACRRARHQVLLSRLAIRRSRQLPRATVRAEWRHRRRQALGAPAVVSGAGEIRDGVDLYGSADKMPVLPHFDNLELEPGEEYRATDQSLGSHGDPNGPSSRALFLVAHERQRPWTRSMFSSCTRQ